PRRRRGADRRERDGRTDARERDERLAALARVVPRSGEAVDLAPRLDKAAGALERAREAGDLRRVGRRGARVAAEELELEVHGCDLLSGTLELEEELDVEGRRKLPREHVVGGARRARGGELGDPRDGLEDALLAGRVRDHVPGQTDETSVLHEEVV